MNWAQELEPADVSSDGGSSRYLSPTGTDFYMGGTPWNLPERYLANSPLWHSDTVSAPILLIHSDMDNLPTPTRRSIRRCTFRRRMRDCSSTR